MLNLLHKLSTVQTITCIHSIMNVLFANGSSTSKNPNSVRATCVSLMCEIAKSRKRFREKLLEFAFVNIVDLDFRIRCQCALLMSLSCDRNKTKQCQHVQLLLSELLDDSEARVRHVALSCLLELHHRSVVLDVSFYPKIINCLKDVSEQVRNQAISLTWILSALHRDHNLNSSNNSASENQLLLINDGFSKLCSAVTDSSIQVRAKVGNFSYYFWIKFSLIFSEYNRSQSTGYN